MSMFSHSFCSHVTGDATLKWLTRCPVSLPLPREGNHRHSGRSVHANRPAPLPCCPCPHSSPPNQCLPTDTSRPFITFLTASVQPQNRAPEGSTAAPNHTAPSFALSCKKTSTRKRRQTVRPEKAQLKTETLPFDSSLFPSRSSRLSPAPTARQNITISSISSAWLPVFSPFTRLSVSRLGCGLLCL